jgi:glutathione peroxidase
LVNNKGEVVKRFSPNTNPSEIKPDIEVLLKEVKV